MDGDPYLEVLTHSILPFAGILVVLVVIHELGHFITAKMAGVQVLEFGIGYPPKIWGIQKGETEYTINLLPLGGFVRLLGEEDPTAPRSLAGKPAGTRLIVMGAGSFMNFVLAILLFTIALMIPKEIAVGGATISQVVPGSPAAMAGLKSGDEIVSIGGRKVENTADASYNIRLRLGEDTDFVVQRTDAATRETKRETVTVRPRWAPPAYVYQVRAGDDVSKVVSETGFDAAAVRDAAGIKYLLDPNKDLTLPDGTTYTTKSGDTVQSVAKATRVPEEDIAKLAGLPDQNTLPSDKTTLNFAQGATGIRIASQTPFTETRSYGPFEAFKKGWQQTFDSLKLARNQIVMWVKGAGSAPVSGPIGIAQATGEVVDQAGWRSLVDLAALLSINLAILNILPLPMLDGGRMAFVLIEVARRGRRISPQKEAMVHFVGMVALLILVVVLSYFDVARIVRGDTLFR
jgi:regulator of sigma E protease